MMSAKTLFLATRPHYLVLSILLVCLGAGLAGAVGPVQWLDFWLCLLGLVLLHISTNVLNDYFDYSSGIDLETRRTSFNGGSGVLNEGVLAPRQMLLFGLCAFFLAVPIGAFLVATVGWPLLPLFLLGSVFVLGNTSHLTRFGFGLGELAAGLGLGALPVFGTAWILHGKPEAGFMLAAVPAALWVSNLLLLNEFPDEQADRLGGRKTLVIQLGFSRAWWVYAVCAVAAYGWIATAVLAGAMPWQCLSAFLSLPLAVSALARSRRADYGGDFLKAQAANVGLTLSGIGLLAVGYWLASA